MPIIVKKPISSEEGNRLGLIDAVVPLGELLKASRLWALDIVERRKPWKCSLHLNDKIGSFSEANEIILAARKHAKQIARNMPQHQACLDVIESGIARGGYSGCLEEAKVFKELVALDTSKGLVHSFFSQRMTSKVRVESFVVVSTLMFLKKFTRLEIYRFYQINLLILLST